MDLSPDEFRDIKKQNQRMKALTAMGGCGQVTALWKGGKLEKIVMTGEFPPTVEFEPESRIELKD